MLQLDFNSTVTVSLLPVHVISLGGRRTRDLIRKLQAPVTIKFNVKL